MYRNLAQSQRGRWFTWRQMGFKQNEIQKKQDNENKTPETSPPGNADSSVKVTADRRVGDGEEEKKHGSGFCFSGSRFDIKRQITLKYLE